MLENTEGAIQMDNSEKLATQDEGKHNTLLKQTRIT